LNHKKKKDQRFDDGALVRPDFRGTGRRIQPRKIAQLCAQIRHALELALLGVVHDDALIDVEVFEVNPMPDPGRVRVTFVAHGDRPDIPELTARLEAVRGILTAEVAQAISRKRVPDLVFEFGRASE
jgi:ribosome-binding factor A